MLRILEAYAEHLILLILLISLPDPLLPRMPVQLAHRPELAHVKQRLLLRLLLLGFPLWGALVPRGVLRVGFRGRVVEALVVAVVGGIC